MVPSRFHCGPCPVPLYARNMVIHDSMSKLYRFSEWLDMPDEAPDWLIPGLLERGGGGMLHGPSQAYKSFIALQVCLDVGAGKPVLDLFPATRPARACLFQAEGSRQAWRRRIRNQAQFYQHDTLFWSEHIYTPDLESPAGQRQMQALLDEVAPDLVVVDPLAEFFVGSDSDAVKVQQWLRVLNAWKAAYGCATIFVHHDRQPIRLPDGGVIEGGVEEARGSTRLPAWGDFIAGVRRRGTAAVLTIQKVRDAESGQVYTLALKDGRLRVASQSNTEEALIVRILQAGERHIRDVMAEGAAATNGSPSRIYRVIRQMLAKGTLRQRDVGRKHMIWVPGGSDSVDTTGKDKGEGGAVLRSPVG